MRARRIDAHPEPKLDLRSTLWGVLLTLLDWNWSRQLVAGILKRVWPQDPGMQVSQVTIYTAICAQPRGELRRQLVACVHHVRSSRIPRKRGTGRQGQVPDMLSIHVRPPGVEDRVMSNDWEGDFIKGAGNKSSVGVLVERSTRLARLAKMDDAKVDSVLAGSSSKLNSIAEPMRQSLTYDQGKEMSRHQDLTIKTAVKAYFCDPHSPWQHTTCGNTNRLLRQDLPIHSQDEHDAVADSLNNRPRSTRAVRSPLEVFGRMLATAQQPSTSIH